MKGKLGGMCKAAQAGKELESAISNGERMRMGVNLFWII